MKNKKYALELLKAKINGERIISYSQISTLTNYSKMHLIRLSKELENKDIDSMLIHSNTGKSSHNSASLSEIQYILEFKKQYPNISIAQFMDFYHEDIIHNPDSLNDILKYNLKERSYSFFKDFFSNNNIKSPRKHRHFKGKDAHPLREPSSRRGILIMIDGTPHDWFDNGKKFSLHLSIDDATGEVLSGWFMPTECLEGYCYMLKFLIKKHGIPENIYSDKHTIFKSPIDGNLTQLGRMCNSLGINMIFAETAQAKGKIEKQNDTIQGRLINDIKRKKITSYSQLNIFFNNEYADYLNRKFSYSPKEKEVEFVHLRKNFDLSTIFYIKENRKILSGCVFSFENNYYQLVDHKLEIIKPFKGTTLEVMKDVFDNTIRVKYKEKIYNTVQVSGHRHDIAKRQQKIANQKELEEYLNSPDKRRN
jgi:Integrase core domain.